MTDLLLPITGHTFQIVYSEIGKISWDFRKNKFFEVLDGCHWKWHVWLFRSRESLSQKKEKAADKWFHETSHKLTVSKILTSKKRKKNRARKRVGHVPWETAIFGVSFEVKHLYEVLLPHSVAPRSEHEGGGFEAMDVIMVTAQTLPVGQMGSGTILCQEWT